MYFNRCPFYESYGSLFIGTSWILIASDWWVVGYGRVSLSLDVVWEIMWPGASGDLSIIPPIIFKSNSQIFFAVVLKKLIQSQWNFAHTMTAQLSWYVQNFIMIEWTLEQIWIDVGVNINKPISITFEIR